jgi:nitrite reductase (NO-forming)
MEIMLKKMMGENPTIAPGANYTYSFTAEPAGLLMYHCHMKPTSWHIRMGMYGAIIVDPKQNQQPAREFVLVMSECDPKDINDTIQFIPELYPINGYKEMYMGEHSLKAYYALLHDQLGFNSFM